MQFGLKNNGGMEIHIDEFERQLIWEALCRYSSDMAFNEEFDVNETLLVKFRKVNEIKEVFK